MTDTAIDNLAQEIQINLKNADKKIWTSNVGTAARLLSVAQASGLEHDANQYWFLWKISFLIEKYIDFFSHVCAKNYYPAWCILEEIEIGLRLLRENLLLDGSKFELAGFAERVEQWQGLFPYKVFLSPEIIIKKHECSICGSEFSPWSHCPHEVGKVYIGKECYLIAKDIEVVSISLVRNPVQKYSVAFLVNESGETRDHYNYAPVQFVASRLETPFCEWRATWTTQRHPHSMFSSHEPAHGCPCGSGRQYLKCCMAEAGVLRPHLQVEFLSHPKAGLPDIEYSY